MYSRAYGIFGLAMLGIMSLAQWSGFSLGGPGSSSRRGFFMPGIPRTIRENPGALRPNYGGSHSPFGGK
jgi:hypothetical protein